MSHSQESLQEWEISRPCHPGPTQVHQYDNVSISGTATAILGDVHHYHTVQAENVHPEVARLKIVQDQLAYLDMHSRLQTLNEPYPDTFRWIFNPPGDSEGDSHQTRSGKSAPSWDPFIDWLKDGLTPYWISGKLGTGKSTLMKYIVESLSHSYNGYGETTDTIVISHFFWEPGSKLQNSILGCLRSLLWQLLHFTQSMRRETSSIIRDVNLNSTGRLRNDLIKTICNTNKTVVILLDGLDECRETDDILNLVEALTVLPHVKLCISSRREEVYMLQFSDFAKLRLQDLNHRDIEQYVETELLQNPRLRRSPSWNADSARVLATSIINDAEGVFLWVRLVIKDLLRGWTNRDDLERMHKRLQKLPHDIYNLYSALIRRDQEDIAEYAEEAAIYFRLLAQSSDRMMSLIAFSFSVNNGIRARYLDVDTVFNLCLDELEQDVDLETLITWINARTAGLLEVKEDRDVFRLNNGHRPGPCGKYIVFQKHWVGFIHRSAYTYLQDTSEGQKLMTKCSMNPDTIMNVYFESEVAARLIVPGTYNFRFVNRGGFHSIFPNEAMISPLIRQWCRLLQTVCDNLLARKLMIVTKDWKANPFWEQSSSSPHQTIDLCMLFVHDGPNEAAEILMQEFEDENEHLANITLAMVRRRTAEGLVDQSAISRLLQLLAPHVSALHSTEPTPDREKLSFQSQLAWIATKVSKAQAAPIWSFLKANSSEDCSLSLPSSRELIEFYCKEELDPEVQISSVLSINSMEAWTNDCDLGEYSTSGRALFFTDNRSGSPGFRIISPTDSDEVLEWLRMMVSSVPWKLRMTNQECLYGFYPGVNFRFICIARSIFSKGLQQIFDRSLCCSSFVDCLRHMGKSEAMIDCAVGERVEIAVHNNFLPWDFVLFRTLLGSDPQKLASWCEKYPQLARLLDSRKVDEEITLARGMLQ